MNVYILGGKRREVLPNQEFFIKENITDLNKIYYVQGPFCTALNPKHPGYKDKFIPTNLHDIEISEDYVDWRPQKEYRLKKIIEHCLQYYCDDWSLFLHADMIPITKMNKEHLLEDRLVAACQGMSMQFFLKHPKFMQNNLETLYASTKINRWTMLGNRLLDGGGTSSGFIAPGFFHLNSISKDKDENYLNKVAFVQKLREWYERDGEWGMYDFVQKMFNISVEALRWHVHKKPERSKEEVERIFNICEECEEFNRYTEDDGQCGICHCPLKKHLTDIIVPIAGIPANKIQLGTTTCPLKEPKWEREI